MVKQINSKSINRDYRTRAINRVLAEAKYFKHIQLYKKDDDLWSNRMSVSLKKFFKNNEELDEKNVYNFRKNRIFLCEMPSFKYLFPFYWLIGSRRGQRN